MGAIKTLDQLDEAGSLSKIIKRCEHLVICLESYVEVGISCPGGTTLANNYPIDVKQVMVDALEARASEARAELRNLGIEA